MAAVLSRRSIQPVASSMEVGPVSDEVLDFLAGVVEYHLRDVLQEAAKVGVGEGGSESDVPFGGGGGEGLVPPLLSPFKCALTPV
jgi:hypothetical protein